MKRKPATVAEVEIALKADLLIPIDHFRATVGNRSTFYKMQRQGLKVLKFNNRRCVRPSELRAFQERMATPAPCKDGTIT